MLVGFGHSDDAAVYLAAPDLAVVQSIDIFGPVVDDPFDFGRIAAANALSDLYAMGVEPAFALAFVGFPMGDLPESVLEAILAGGAEACRQAGASIIGGHSIRDKEPKYGLAVTGFGRPDAIVTNAGGRPGDALVLTKPLGSGILTTALKRQLLGPDAVRDVTELMATLNRGASAAARAAGVHAMTDVTGFGLLGHLAELARASGVAAEVDAAAVPLLPGVLTFAGSGVVPGGSRRNLTDLGPAVRFDDAVPEPLRLALGDAQTSGGLLIAVAPERLPALLAGLGPPHSPAAAVIGRLVARAHPDTAPLIHVR